MASATDAKNKKKYTLFSAESGDGSKRPCAFFNTPAGCRMGENCKFLHSRAAVEPDPQRKTTIPTTNSVVSSEESDGEMESDKGPQFTKAPTARPPTAPAASYASLAEEPKSAQSEEKLGKKKRKRRSKSNASDNQIFAQPKNEKDVFESPKSSNEKNKAKNKPTTRSIEKPAEAAPSPHKKVKQEKKDTKQETLSKTKKMSGPDFRKLNLPIASFSLPATKEDDDETPKEIKSKPVSKPKTSTSPPASPVSVPEPIPPHYAVPNSTEVGRKWKDLVIESQSHPDFASIFDLSKYKNQDIPGDAWVQSKPFGDWCKDYPQAIAIDCEMCETQDPVSGQKNYNALCRISVVNAEDPNDVLLDTLVKPSWPVTDYRTFVNGISKKDLDPVQFTTRHAQAFMMALCSDETVILGHALHNDLAAIRMEHFCVADSALLFKASDSETATVSLKDMAMSILKKEMPSTHDSVNDARTALLCLDHYRANKGHVDPIVRTPSNRTRNGIGPRTHHMLFIHRIPKICKAEHIAKMFLDHTAIAPEEVEEIDFTSGSSGKTYASFKTKKHAMLAFEALDGAAEPDKSGRLQKRVYIRGGDYVRIRKMNHEPDRVRPDDGASSPDEKAKQG